MDVIARAEVWEILRHLPDVTIIMSTGYLDEAERCDELIYLYEGRIRTRGTPDAIRSNYPYQAYRLVGRNVEAALAALQPAAWLVRTQTLAGSVVLESTAEIAQVRAGLHELGTAEVWVEPLPPTLELVFTHLTHEAQADDAGGH